MLYNDSSYLKDVEWVIFDEVHYINDAVSHFFTHLVGTWKCLGGSVYEVARSHLNGHALGHCAQLSRVRRVDRQSQEEEGIRADD